MNAPGLGVGRKQLRTAGNPDKWVRTTCGFCGVGFQFDAGIKGNQLVTMKPATDRL
ncbi:MAG: hypothetical protein CM1200mP29_04290 [Verrucomicrobiota bacterium]|nr:MAG: hypothetical protein CM1200mP29_04290 [Verrucomicrobiota bacterium]